MRANLKTIFYSQFRLQNLKIKLDSRNVVFIKLLAKIEEFKVDIPMRDSVRFHFQIRFIKNNNTIRT